MEEWWCAAKSEVCGVVLGSRHPEEPTYIVLVKLVDKFAGFWWCIVLQVSHTFGGLHQQLEMQDHPSCRRTYASTHCPVVIDESKLMDLSPGALRKVVEASLALHAPAKYTCYCARYTVLKGSDHSLNVHLKPVLLTLVHNRLKQLIVHRTVLVLRHVNTSFQRHRMEHEAHKPGRTEKEPRRSCHLSGQAPEGILT